jgi:glycosyltransferase involved in cell wall biosynthesis
MQSEFGHSMGAAVRDSVPDATSGLPLIRTATRSALSSAIVSRRPRILHCVGHLLRGGIEMGLFSLLTSENAAWCEHHILVRTAEQEAFTEQFQNAGIPVLCCSSYQNPLRYARELKVLIKQHGPYDILHVHGSSFSGLLTLALAHYCGIRWRIVHSHNDVRPFIEGRSLLHRAYVRTVLGAYRRLADFGFAASELAAESMFGTNWRTDDRWKLFYFGIDTRPFRVPKDSNIRRSLSIPDDAPVLGHVGRFHEQKNHAFLLEIVEAAAGTNPELRCLLIGDGPLRPQFIREIRRRGLESRFVFVPDTLDVAAYMTNAMDCFIFPSKYEGFGLVVVEAQAAGMPCLISDRVPTEAIVDESLVTVLPLEAGAARWSETALGLMRERLVDRARVVGRIERSRFSLEVSARTLWDHYGRIAGAMSGAD